MKAKEIYGFLLIMSFSVACAQTLKKDPNSATDPQVYKNINHFGIKDFINMDLGLIAFMPMENDWKHILIRLNSVPKDSLRYIDSLSIINKQEFNDTLYVKVYSQNYAYHSQNTYKIVKDRDLSKDTLMIYKMHIDLKIKSSIDNGETFRDKNFDVYITEKNINKEHRILFNKKYYK